MISRCSSSEDNIASIQSVPSIDDVINFPLYSGSMLLVKIERALNLLPTNLYHPDLLVKVGIPVVSSKRKQRAQV